MTETLSLRKIYQGWKLNGVSFFLRVINFIFLSLAVFFIPFENANYKRFRENFTYYYPQINPKRPRFLDPLRVVIQSLFLLTVKQIAHDDTAIASLSSVLIRWYFLYIYDPIVRVLNLATSNLKYRAEKDNYISQSRKPLAKLFLTLSSVASIIAVTQPFDANYQFVFVALMWILAILLKSVKNRIALMLMIFISIIISTRYIYWRTTDTVLFTDGTTVFFALTLLIAEIYAYIVLLLSYFQVCWVLDRRPYPLPKDTNLWPTVDIFIPSYNEPLDVVKPCLLAALDIDWPQDKIKVHLLDDGSRIEFERYCKSIGVNYIKRDEHKHAKAGNINHALTLTDGSIIAIFDCDHIPTRSFLQMTVGWMVFDKNIALVQTPHHFYSDDPFEKNLSIKGEVPAENSLFHDFIQKGNDTWNATMFCGSCAIIRRGPLEEIGGIAVETVTEDAHTSLRLNRKGYSSAFISMPLAAGLATESLADHINQRIRWARGMVQIFRIDNPLFGKGLTFPQRVCFANSMIHFLHGLPRIIFLLAPLPFLFANIYVIFASGMMIFAYVLPHMIHSTMTNQRIQGNKRFYFWGVIYETILSWYITLPTLVALISPAHGKFNVTSKGESNEETFFDWTTSKAYIFMILLNFTGLIYGLYKVFFDPYCEPFIILINVAWVCYNLLVLGAASAVALERRQVRAAPRVSCSMDAVLEINELQSVHVTITDFSKDGLGISIPQEESSKLSIADFLYVGKTTYINILNNKRNYRFKTEIRFSSPRKLGLIIELNGLQENIEYIRCTFACADRWSHSFENLKQDTLLHGIHTLVKFGLNGYLKMLNNAPFLFKQALWVVVNSLLFVFSLLPVPLDINSKKARAK